MKDLVFGKDLAGTGKKTTIGKRVTSTGNKWPPFLRSFGLRVSDFSLPFAFDSFFEAS